MYILIMIVHVFVCLFLIAVILLQAGRGGGLSEMAGGQPQSILGTQTNAFMTRTTEVCAILFVITSLSLGILSSQKGKSLVERQRMMDKLLAKTKTVSAPMKASEQPGTEGARPAAEKALAAEAPASGVSPAQASSAPASEPVAAPAGGNAS